MITGAVLRPAPPQRQLARVGGLRVLERQLFLLRRAGLRRVWVGTPHPDGARDLRFPEGLEVLWASHAGAAPAMNPPYLCVSGLHLMRLATLRQALAEEIPGPVSWQDNEGRRVLEVVRHEVGAPSAMTIRHLAPDESIPVTHPADPALGWLLRGAVKGNDGFMARHFDRRISLAVTRRLLDTCVTPNQMTLISVAIGLAGAVFFVMGTYSSCLAGALLVWLHSTLDGCDGELARLKFLESPLGGVLDFWGDNGVHAALFLGLGLGLSRAQSTPGPLLLGLVAAASATASATLAYSHSKRKAATGNSGPFFNGVADVSAGAALTEKRLAAVEDALAQRDFVYLLVLSAALGRSEWFLWAAAVGSPIFLAILLWLHRKRLSPGR